MVKKVKVSKVGDGPVSKNDSKRAKDSEEPTSNFKRARLFAIIFSIVVILLFAFMVLFPHYHAQSVNEKNKYNGFDFSQIQSDKLTLWKTTINVKGQPYIVPFYYHPRDLEDIPMEQGVTDELVNKEPKVLYITFSSDAGSKPVIGGVEVSRFTGSRYKLLNIETHAALKDDPKDGAQHLLINCAKATNRSMVLSYDHGNNTIIYRDHQHPSCIHLEYRTPDDSIRVSDRFAYGLLRIMHG